MQRYRNRIVLDSSSSEDSVQDVSQRHQLQLPVIVNHFVFSNFSRPTTASSSGAKLWSRQRQMYQHEMERDLEPFAHRPYVKYEYPEIGKHYPGTWRTAGKAELDSIVSRLTRRTAASIAREEDIKTQYSRVLTLRGKSTKVKM